MIATSLVIEKEFKAAEADPRFRLDPPVKDPFLPMTSISLTAHKAGVAVEWHEAGVTGAMIPAEVRIAEGMLRSSQRDAQRFPRSARAHANLGSALLNLGRLDE